MAEFDPKTPSEWLAIILGNFGTVAGFTPEEGTNLYAMLYAVAVALAASDTQRTMIYWEPHAELATRLGLELLADDLGVSYSQATTSATLRAAVRLARLTNIGTKGWYEGLPPLLYPKKVTSALAIRGHKGPGSVGVIVYFNGGQVDNATVEALQADFNSDDCRPLTDRVTVSTPVFYGI